MTTTIIIIIEIHRQNENELMQCSSLVEQAHTIEIGVCARKNTFNTIAACIIKQTSVLLKLNAKELSHPECIAHADILVIETSRKLIFIQIGIKTCSGNYDSEFPKF